MISTATYSAFFNNIEANRFAPRIFYLITINDSAANTYKWTDHPTQLGDFVPTKLSVSTVNIKANLYEGDFSVSPVQVKIENVLRGQTDTTFKRFAENFTAESILTEICTIQLIEIDGDVTGSLFPFYQGRIANVNFNVMEFSFDVVDRTIYELPDLPGNLFDRTSYPEAPEDIIGKPIPLVYGTWDSVTTNKYIDRVFVPLLITENNLTAATPNMKMIAAGHAADAISDVVIYDGDRSLPGYIQDTIVKTLSTSEVEIDFNTANADSFLTAIYYANAVSATATAGTGSVSNPGNSVDGDSSTYSVVTGTTTSGTSLEFGQRDIKAWTEDDLKNSNLSADLEAYIYSDTSGATATVTLENSLKSTTSPATSTDPGTFNVTIPDLKLKHTQYFDGTTDAIFRLREDTTGLPTNTDFILSSGIYYTNSALATEMQRFADNDPVLQNTYSIKYLANENKFEITKLSGLVNFQIDPTVGAGKTSHSSMIGFTVTSSASTTSVKSDTYTQIDIPDGDFSTAKVKVEPASVGTGSVRVIGTRFKITYKIKTFSIIGGAPAKKFGAINNQGRPTVTEFWNRYQDRNIKRTTRKRLESAIDTIQGSKFFCTMIGREFGSWIGTRNGLASGQPINHAPYIVESLLRDEAYITTAEIDTAAFDAAYTNLTSSTSWEVQEAAYIDRKTSFREIVAELMRYARGFFYISQAGQYKVICLKSSYSSGDVDKTIQLYDLGQSFEKGLKISIVDQDNLSNDLTFRFAYDPMTDNYNSFVTKSNTGTLNIPAREISCPYITVDDSADSKGWATNIATHFGGDGAAKGQFGSPKMIIDAELLNKEYLFIEPGDILTFSSDFDSHLKGFNGVSLSSLFFMAVEKQYSRDLVKLKLMEL